MNISPSKILIVIGFAMSLLIMPFTKDQAVLEVASQEVSESTSSTEPANNIVVQVQGAVAKPGIYEMTTDQRINDLLTVAEVKEYNSSCINLAQKLVDEQNLYVPAKNEKCINDESISTEGVVNINTANSLELQTLTGIGESKSNAIVEYRDQNGTFQDVHDLTNVDGISEGLLLDIQPQISLS